jgi:hypothetical protein
MVREALATPTKRVEFVFAALGQTRQLVDVADAELDVRRALKA